LLEKNQAFLRSSDGIAKESGL